MDIKGELEIILNRAEKISFEGREILIWGTNAVTDMNKEVIDKLRPSFFVDNDKEKQGREKWNIKIIAPNEIENLCKNPIILISAMRFGMEIAQQLRDMDLDYHTLDEYILGQHKKELLEVYDLLETAFSKELFFKIIVSRINAQEIPEKYINQDQYFARKEFKIIDPKETFVDIGAYVGDTIEKYIWKKAGQFKEIYAFEPDNGNVNAMSKRVERLQCEWGIPKDKIHIIKGAVGKQNGKAFITDDLIKSNVKVVDDETGYKVQMYTLDSFFKDMNHFFIKVDIEGCELEMIEGAAENIRKYKPMLAICIYHKAEDLYKIPLLLKRLNKEYRMDLAHHDYTYSETVLYCY